MSNLVFAVVLGRREDVPARYPDSRISKLECPRNNSVHTQMNPVNGTRKGRSVDGRTVS